MKFLYLFFFALFLVLVSILMIFFYAPLEIQMGVVQKIFYFHASSAINMLLAFSLCGIFAFIYLITRGEIFDAILVSVAEIGVLLSAIVLTTGPIWAKKSWGTFWTWEPRLLFTLLLFLLFLGYLSLRSYTEGESFAKKVAAGLAVMGLPVSYLIHIAVEKWGGGHPQVIFKAGLQNPQMKITLIVSIFAIFFLSFTFSFLRYKLERQKQKIDALFLKKEDLKEVIK